MTKINTRKRDIKSLIANKQTTIENELDTLIVKVNRLTKELDETRSTLRVAVGLISTVPQYTSMHPEQVLKMLKDTAPMFKLSRGSYAQKTKELLEATRGLSSTTSIGNQKIECLRSHLELVTKEMERYYNALTPAQRENLPSPESVQENID